MKLYVALLLLLQANLCKRVLPTPLQAEAKSGDEEEQDEVLALPAPEGCQEGTDLEAEMQAAIASAEMSGFAKV